MPLNLTNLLKSHFSIWRGGLWFLVECKVFGIHHKEGVRVFQSNTFQVPARASKTLKGIQIILLILLIGDSVECEASEYISDFDTGKALRKYWSQGFWLNKVLSYQHSSPSEIGSKCIQTIDINHSPGG
jgi:hypothetical protein